MSNTHTSQPSEGARAATRFREVVGRIWRWLTEPSASITERDHRRQAQLLAAALITLILVALTLETLAIVTNAVGNTFAGYANTFAAVSLLVIAYSLSRTRHYPVGAVLSVVTASVAILAAATSEGPVLIGMFGYLVVPILFGSMFLVQRIWLGLVAANLAGLLLVPLLIPSVTYQQILIGPLGYVGTTTALFLLVAWHRDLVERDQRAELAEREERYRTLVEQLPAMTYLDAMDPASPLGIVSLYVSPQFEPLLGYSPAEYRANPGLWHQLIHADDRERVLAEEARHYTSGERSVQEYRLIARDGRVLWVRDECALRWDPASQRRVSQGILLDITERKEADNQIRRNAARANALRRTAERLNARLDLEAVLNAVCEQAIQALNVPFATVSLYDEQRKVLRPAADIGLPPEYRRAMQPVPYATYHEYAQHMSALVVTPDVQALPNQPNADLYAALDIRTTVGAAMQHDRRLVGRLNIGTQGEVRQFDDEELNLLKGLADQAALALINSRLFTEAQRRLERLKALRAIDIAITARQNLGQILNLLLDQITAQLNVDAAVLLLLDPRMQTITFAARRGFRTGALRHTRLLVGQGYAGRAALERRTVHIPDLSANPLAFAGAPLLLGEDFVAYYAAPLIAEAEVKGVLEVFHRAPLDPEVEWLDFLEALAGQAAIAIDSATLVEGLQRSNSELSLAYDTTIEGWSRALDLRDQETEGHSQRVTEMTLRLARRLGLSESELVHIRRGALLHDIGKMGVPDGILLKPGPLTEAEWAIMRKHPVHAYEMLSPILYLRPALDIPYDHHEKWDGTGYPRGLKGEAIPLAARIFAVVDVWDALRSDRPYRAAWSEDRVRAHIQSLAGTHFDPQVVDAFTRLIAEESTRPLG
jgi:PAS domain S-box-containing protein/putative nucleotidyltransferase with HDIG domain